MTTAFSERVLGTLETLIAPGGRARISPFVEIAQAASLFPGSLPERRTIRNLEGVIRANPSVIGRLATVWETFSSNKTFSDPKWYRQRDFLDFYLAYYFPVNVAKLQTNLLQYLRREGRFPAELHVIDVGVGTGTTIIAIADFLLAWDSASQLHGLSIPVSSLTYTGIDRSEEALQAGRQVADAYLQAMQASNQGGALVSAQVAKGLAGAQWIPGDRNSEMLSSKFGSANLMVCSYVLDELGNEAERLALVEQSLRMPDGGLLLLLEAGGQRTATNLMRLRAQMLKQHRSAFSSTGPCGDLATAHSLDAACGQCWNARQESLAEPQIYRAVRKEFQKRKADGRSFDEFENRLLSWSYLWMTRGKPSEVTLTVAEAGGIRDETGTWPEIAVLHYRRRIEREDRVPGRKAAGGGFEGAAPHVAMEAKSPPFDHRLINDAMAKGRAAGRDTGPIQQEMKAKNYAAADELARQLLASLLPDDDDRDPYARERGPDESRNSPETLIFCWHPRGGIPTEVLLPRPTGLQLPKLVHGDEVRIANAWYERGHGRKVVLACIFHPRDDLGASTTNLAFGSGRWGWPPAF